MCRVHALPVFSGVPQGSLLGPRLFLIFVNDLPASVSSSVILLFADNTKCAYQIIRLPDCLSLQLDLNQLTLWSKDWNLHFNEDKCVLMRFCSRREPLLFNYYINSKQVVTKMIHRDLSMLMLVNLHWTDHYELSLKRA